LPAAFPAGISGDLYTAGYKQVTSIDISDVVIGQMQKIYKDKTEMQCERAGDASPRASATDRVSMMAGAVMDARELKFEANDFDFVFDKGLAAPPSASPGTPTRPSFLLPKKGTQRNPFFMSLTSAGVQGRWTA
jgi:hypothetical protein